MQTASIRPRLLPLILSAAALCGGATASASAATLYTLPAPTGAMATPGGFDISFAAGAGSGAIALQIQGYNTLDGDNFWIDILTITLNGSPVLSGTWDLGGGGTNRVLANPLGGTVSYDAVARTVALDLPVTLRNGSNTLSVAYDSPTTFEGVDRAGPQSIGDEGWGLNTLSVDGALAPVPEPGAAVLLGLGLGLAVLIRRRRIPNVSRMP